ncbi:MAG: shikimate dehydrogenase [Clostridia bacterium]|nr:shikimate dehydrogenase [Clostridia bacterium]
MFEINGHTKQLAILGYPVEHSFSPQMHNFISEKMGLNYVYTALEVSPDKLKDAIEGIRAMKFAGVNITAPHKYEVMKYIDEISEQARKFGSVNTVVNKCGKLVGYNTDADGFYRSLLHEGIEIKDRDVLIIGAGGASKPVCVLFSQIGAKSITLVNRTKEKAEELAEYIHTVCGYKISTTHCRNHYDVVINTTSAGMYPQLEECPLDDMSFIDKKTAVADMIYNPSETVFLKRAKKAGAKTINGLGMLIYQGIIAYELFTNIKLPENIFETVTKEVFSK